MQGSCREPGFFPVCRRRLAGLHPASQALGAPPSLLNEDEARRSWPPSWFPGQHPIHPSESGPPPLQAPPSSPGRAGTDPSSSPSRSPSSLAACQTELGGGAGGGGAPSQWQQAQQAGPRPQVSPFSCLCRTCQQLTQQGIVKD